MSIQSINPASGKLVKTFKPYSKSRIESSLTRAHNTYLEWRTTSFVKRRKLMIKAAQVLRKNKERYATYITVEMGKPITESRAEVEKCAWVCEYYSKMAETFLKDEIIKTEYQKSFVAFQPIGAILAVMPWNFPFWQVIRFAAPALMAGNVGILKHASNVPQSSLAIEEVFSQAGFPKGAFTSLLIPSSAVEGVLVDDRIAAVTLTGSEGAGALVASTASKHIKKSVLELGGSDPFIVLKDADIPKACEIAVNSRMISTGQSCIAAKRFIVEKTVEKKFTDLFVELMAAKKVGDPMDPGTQVGPLARQEFVTDIDHQVVASVRKGATLLLGGKRIKGPGYFYEPTILGNVKPGMPAYDEETFGPVASIITAKNERDAIRIANDTRFGLGANLWTKNIKKGELLARQIESGAVFINDFTKSDPRLPFGGIKKSGYGRELSHYGIKEFVNVKTIVIK